MSRNERPRTRRLTGAALVATLCLAPLLVLAWIGLRDEPKATVESGQRAMASSVPHTIGPKAATKPTIRSPERTATTVTTEDDEPTVLAELRKLGLTDPERSLALIRSSTAEASADAAPAELLWFEARALVELGRFDEARAVAHLMLEHHPNEPWTTDARRHLLSHPFGLPLREH